MPGAFFPFLSFFSRVKAASSKKRPQNARAGGRQRRRGSSPVVPRRDGSSTAPEEEAARSRAGCGGVPRDRGAAAGTSRRRRAPVPAPANRGPRAAQRLAGCGVLTGSASACSEGNPPARHSRGAVTRTRSAGTAPAWRGFGWLTA